MKIWKAVTQTRHATARQKEVHLLFILTHYMVTVPHSITGSLVSQSDTVGDFTINPKWKDVTESSLRNVQRRADRCCTGFIKREELYELLILCRLAYLHRKKMCLIIPSLFINTF